MNFLEAVNVGLEKARQTRAEIDEIDAIFKEMNAELQSYGPAKLQIKRAISTTAGMKLALRMTVTPGPEPKWDSEYMPEDMLNLHVTRRSDGVVVKKRISGWRQKITGYPCTLDFEGQATVCHTKENLNVSLRELLQSSTFGQALAEALNQ